LTVEHDQDTRTARREVVKAFVVGLVLALPAAVLLDVFSSRSGGNPVTMAVFEYDDGKLVAAVDGHPEPRDAAITGSGLVRLLPDVRQHGWPAVSTVRRQPSRVTISPIRGGGFGGPVTSAERQAIVAALRQAGAEAELDALEGRLPPIERRWWGWVINTLSCWVFASCGASGLLGMAALVRQTRGELRTSEGQCPSCGYDLSGRPQSEQCPECGTRLPQRARYWARYRARRKSRGP
jgi:hypothetical protein